MGGPRSRLGGATSATGSSVVGRKWIACPGAGADRHRRRGSGRCCRWRRTRTDAARQVGPSLAHCRECVDGGRRGGDRLRVLLPVRLLRGRCRHPEEPCTGCVLRCLGVLLCLLRSCCSRTSTTEPGVSPIVRQTHAAFRSGCTSHQTRRRVWCEVQPQLIQRAGRDGPGPNGRGRAGRGHAPMWRQPSDRPA